MDTIDRVSITSVLDRNETGITRPFFCRCSDGFDYFVKGKYAGIEALCNELIAGQIASFLHLPIPEFRIVEIPSELFEYSLFEKIEEIGRDPAWGLRAIPQAEVFSELHLVDADEEMCIKVLLFDWFVENSDRGSSRGNLLWSTLSHSLHIIDHNLAFDETFDTKLFWKGHLLKDFRDKAFNDLHKQQLKNLLEQCILNMAGYFSNIPPEWSDADCFDFREYKNRVMSILNRLNTNSELFWKGKI